MSAIQLGISVYGQSLFQLRHCLESCLSQQDKHFQLQISIRIDGPGVDSAADDVRAYLRSVAERDDHVCLEEGNERLGTFGSYRKIFSDSQAEECAPKDSSGGGAVRDLEYFISTFVQTAKCFIMIPHGTMLDFLRVSR